MPSQPFLILVCPLVVPPSCPTAILMDPPSTPLIEPPSIVAVTVVIVAKKLIVAFPHVPLRGPLAPLVLSRHPYLFESTLET